MIFYNNPLRDLKKEIDDESFETIVRESEFTVRNSFIEKYVSEEGQKIHYLKNNDLLYLFSYGEYQPGRYMLFLEDLYNYVA